MQKWEYIFVSAEEKYDLFRVKFINGNEVPNWKSGDDIYALTKKLGDEGWELVSAPYTTKDQNWAVARLIFKRPKS